MHVAARWTCGRLSSGDHCCGRPAPQSGAATVDERVWATVSGSLRLLGPLSVAASYRRPEPGVCGPGHCGGVCCASETPGGGAVRTDTAAGPSRAETCGCRRPTVRARSAGCGSGRRSPLRPPLLQRTSTQPAVQRGCRPGGSRRCPGTLRQCPLLVPESRPVSGRLVSAADTATAC
jgi:hypothetical protein